MEYFWYTSDTIPEGLGFSHFGTLHLITLVIALAVLIANCLVYRRLAEKGRGVWRKTVALLLVADELFMSIPMMVMGIFHVKYLPFQLCSINIFLILWHAWKPNKTLGNFLYTVCIPGALAALITPTWTKLPWLNYMFFHSTSAHILLIMYPLTLTVCGEIKPRLKQVPKSLLLLLALAGLALVLNLCLDTNFMFLMSVTKSNPLYFFQELWGSHLLGFPVIIAGVVLVMYAPIEIYHKVRRKKVA
jgi:hypothetical integral membrane protein (TIGR02206 family)